MNCIEVEDALVGGPEALAPNRSWDAFEEHLTECARCGRKLAQTESIRSLIREGCQRMMAPRRLWLRILGALPHRAA